MSGTASSSSVLPVAEGPTTSRSTSEPNGDSSLHQSLSLTVPTKCHKKRRARYTDAIRRKQLKNAAKRYRERHPEAHRAAVAKYQKAHPEVNRRAVAKYRKAHPEVNRRAVAKYRKAHPEVNRRAVAKYRKAHPEVNRRAVARYRKAHPEVHRAAQARYEHSHTRRCIERMSPDIDAEYEIEYEIDSTLALGAMSNTWQWCSGLTWTEGPPGMCCFTGYPNTAIQPEAEEEMDNQGSHQAGLLNDVIKEEKEEEESRYSHGSVEIAKVAWHQSEFPTLVKMEEEEEGQCNQGSEGAGHFAEDQSGYPDIAIKPEAEEEMDNHGSHQAGILNFSIRPEEEGDLFNQGLKENTSIAGGSSGIPTLPIKPEEEERPCSQESEGSTSDNKKGLLNVVVKVEEEEEEILYGQRSVEIASVAWDQSEFPTLVKMEEEEEGQCTQGSEGNGHSAGDHVFNDFLNISPEAARQISLGRLFQRAGVTTPGTQLNI